MKDHPYPISIYGRVSSDRQAEEATIESQVTDLTQRVQDDGFKLDDELCFLDDGYTGEALSPRQSGNSKSIRTAGVGV